MPLDRFALDRFTHSMLPPPALEHTVNLNRFTWSTPPPLSLSMPSTSTASPMPPTVRFADALDLALRSTPSFPSPQVIHEELVNCCRIQNYLEKNHVALKTSEFQ
jgi:hypothetical protein